MNASHQNAAHYLPPLNLKQNLKKTNTKEPKPNKQKTKTNKPNQTRKNPNKQKTPNQPKPKNPKCISQNHKRITH